MRWFTKGIMNKQSLIFLALSICLIFLFSCNKEPKLNNINPTFIWKKNQVEINADSGKKHIWSGFSIKDNRFVATKNFSKLIIWREKTETVDISIYYSLKNEPLEVFVNGKYKFSLRPKSTPQPRKRKIKLSRGFNFIEFRRKRKKPKIQFEIKTIRINDEIKDENFHLPEGEKITHFYSAGSGEISLNGKGKLLIRKVEFMNGKKTIHETNIKAGFLSGTKKYSIRFQALGFLQLSTISGHFDLIHYKFKENPRKKKAGIRVLDEKPDIYIILIDACQASHLGVYGYRRDTSPNIDNFSKDSIVFENAYTNATYTRASVATIFTGFVPYRHKLWVLTHKLRQGLFLLPEFLKKLDYRTAILTETANISDHFGFKQGIDTYYKIYAKPWNNPKYYKNKMSKFFALWIKTKGPLFTYVHFIAPHFPIIPPPPFLDMFKKKKSSQKEERLIIKLWELRKKRSHFSPEEVEDVTADYDSTIRFVDSQVGKMIDSIKEKRSYKSSLIIFTSDHGEALFEHGAWGHGKNVFEETSRIPLIVKFPAKMNLNGRIKKVTQLADIYPTIAEMFGKERNFDGQSLLKSIAIKKMDDTFAFSISMQKPSSIGIRWRSWFYILNQNNNQELLYDLNRNPLDDVAMLNEDMVSFFRAKFLCWLIKYDRLRRTSKSIQLKEFQKDDFENLKSLGYIE